MGAFLLINFFPFIVCCNFLYLFFASDAYRDLDLTYRKNNGETLFDAVAFQNFGFWAFFNAFLFSSMVKHSGGGIDTGTETVITFFLWLAGNPCAQVVKVVDKLTTMREAEKELNPNARKHQTAAHDDFSQNQQSGDFGFNSGRFGGEEKQQAQDPNAPRGYNDRHPDDVKLWAMAEDPAASEGERRNAFSIILKRQARRKLVKTLKAKQS